MSSHETNTNYDTFVLPEGVEEGDNIMNFQPPLEYIPEAAELLAGRLGSVALEDVEVVSSE